LGVKPKNLNNNVLKKLTRIPLKGIIHSNENILYAITMGSRFSDYSLLITEKKDSNDKQKYKIYMVGCDDYMNKKSND